ncbi:MAG: hypothetical protein PHD97_12205 [Bacteroidales bacterium]|nr:hypothetical protein [Bacteroidales bacterium]
MKLIANRVKLVVLFLLWVALSFNVYAATVTTTGSGNWSSTTPNAPWPGGTIPATTDDIVVGAGFTLTVDGDRTCNSMAFKSTSGTLTVNGGVILTVTTSVTLEAINSSNRACTISGAGTINCASVNVGNAVTPSGTSYTTQMTSTLTAFNVSGNFTIYASRNGGRNNDGTFFFSTGTLDIDGTLTTSCAASSTSTFNMNTGSMNGTLKLGGATTFSLGAGTSTLTFNSTSTTVEYDRSGDQTIRGASAYYNLKVSGSGTKTTDAATTVNGALDINAGTLELGTTNITVTGTTTILGTLSDNSTSGTNTFNGPVSVTGSIYYTAAETFTINNNLTLNSGSSINGSATGIVTVSGTYTLTVNAGTSTIGQGTINIGGASTITGTLEINNSTGTKTFTGDVTVNGTWNNSGNSAITIAGNLTVNSGATFTAGTGVYTLSGTAKEINGTIASLSIPSLTTSGTRTNKIPTLTVATALSITNTFTNNYTLIVSGTLGGWGTLSQGISGAYIYVASSVLQVTLTATVSTNTVEYNGGAQTVLSSTYDILKISGTGTKSPGNAVTVNNNLYIDVGGTLDLYTENWTVNGTTSVYGTLTETSTTGTDRFVGKVIIYSGGVWNFTVAETPEFRGGLQHDGATFTSGTGTYEFNTNSQSISGSSAITFDGPVSIYGAITVTNDNTNAVTGLTFNNSLNGSASGSTFDNRGLICYTSSGSATRPMNNGIMIADNSSSTVSYNRGGDQTIKVPSVAYHHLIISGSGTKTLSAGITVNGNLTISAGTLADAGYTLTVKGDITNNATHSGAGKILLSGGSLQHHISGGNFGNIELNDILGVALTSGININNNLTMTGGTFDLNGYNITLCSTCNIVGETNTNYIYGTSGYIQITQNINAPSSLNPGNLGAVITSSANFGSTNIKRGHAVRTGLGNQSILRYYDITPTNNSGLNATLRFNYFDNELNGQTEANFCLYRSTDGGANWISMGNSSIKDYVNNYVEQNSLDHFSQWTVSNSSTNPLPIELLSFNGVYENEKVNLYWSTAAEINNDYFTIERSADGRNFEIITTVKGAGNSNSIIKYSAIDDNPQSGIVYYRLKQTDFDGAYKYSDVISVNANSNNNISGIEVSQPYLSGSSIKAVISNLSGADIYVEIYNVLGAVYYSELFKPSQGYIDINVKVNNLSKGGVYFLRVFNRKEYVVRKFVY